MLKNLLILILLLASHYVVAQTQHTAGDTTTRPSSSTTFRIAGAGGRTYRINRTGNAVRLAHFSDIPQSGGGPAPGTPTVAVGTSAGDGATVTLEAGSNDRRGYIVLTIGSANVTASADLLTLTFGVAYSSTPAVVTSAAHTNTQGNNTRWYQYSETATSFRIGARSAALTAGSVHRWAYIVSP